MSQTVDYQAPANFYRDQFAFEDWLCDFTIEWEKEYPPSHPDHGSVTPVINAQAIIDQGAIGMLVFTRISFLRMFGKEAVESEELRIAHLWAEQEGDNYL